MYKINIHAHSIFSDGINSPTEMAAECKRLGFSAAVITDHHYGPQFPEFSLNEDRYRLLKRACKEAKKHLPIILGMEITFMGQELVIFGSAAIKMILKEGNPNKERLLQLRKETGCACILVHPGDEECWTYFKDVIDGFEQFNSGQNWFEHRGFGELQDLPRWCNSDAHGADGLEKCYNIVNAKIENESDLIRYIKKGSQPDFMVKGTKLSFSP